MAIILQNQMFVWSDYQNSADFYKLNLILKNIPDEKLMQKLEKKRGLSGVNKYPVRAIWNSLIACVVYEHKSIESLRRELSRNPALRDTCGFNPMAGIQAVPTAGAYTRFIKNLIECEDEITAIFNELVKKCYEQLPHFGEHLGIDGKAIQSYAKKNASNSNDKRGDNDAKWGKHVYKGKDKNGKVYEKKKTWFGYLAHIIADTVYELPVEFEVGTANSSEIKTAQKMIEKMSFENPERLNIAKYFTGDKGYDSTKLVVDLWDKHKVNPIIDIRQTWQGEKTRAYEKNYGVIYDNKGAVFCVCCKSGETKKMSFRGFEKDRNSLKYGCPAIYAGRTCKYQDKCKLSKQIRIPLKEDRRIFTPIARSSYKWEKLYKQRTALERINSRLDNVFGFENHTIRGLEKMRFRITLAFIIMQSFAIGKAKEGRNEEIRQLLTA